LTGLPIGRCRSSLSITTSSCPAASFGIYYDRAMEHGSEDRSGPDQTTRVMTVMLADEY
jgi:hypothetical protein